MTLVYFGFIVLTTAGRIVQRGDCNVYEMVLIEEHFTDAGYRVVFTSKPIYTW